MRQIVLDTETTGLDPKQGHRVIEIGCVEIQNRRLTGRHFHYYLNPDRDIDEAAIEVHGLTREFLADKPRFKQIAGEFLEFVSDAELVIHNAPFDIGFLDAELIHMHSSVERMADVCSVLDSLLLAREKHPGQRNSLDALCKRYGVDNTQRELHGALLDAEILADVYLIMTSGQSSLSLRDDDEDENAGRAVIRELDPDRAPLPIISASSDELAAHQARLQDIAQSSGDKCLWLELEAAAEDA
ncbi:MAG: DNA polymerase III subunit epsilon [Pseudohongiellaceae bacterium]|jgi:DNA polymerase-3 subunit epsilon